MASNRMIKSLRDYDHVKIRPTMYVGQIAKTDVKVPIFTNENGHSYIKRVEKYISPAFYKLYDEVLGNAFDEAVRLKGKMPLIEIHFNSKTNEVVVKDTGGGFYKGTELNEISRRSNIETAFTQLRAGSNFEDGDDALIGTNGVGVSLVNMLSEKFHIETINDKHVYKQEWINSHWENNTFSEPQITKRKKEKTGTTVRFIPSQTLFADNVWDKDYIYTLMLLKNFVKNENPLLKNVTFKAFFDNVELKLNVEFLPKNSFFIESKIGKVWVYPIMQESTDISFINGQLCEGIHEKIISDYINNIFGFQYAHWYYNTFISLNLHPKLVRFADQNKTKFATGKLEILPEIKKNLFTKLETIKTNKFVWNFVNKKITEYEKLNALKEFKRAKRKSESVQFSSKYYPAAVNKDYIFIAEGLSASGGLTENRDTKNVGVYALKGKIKNVRNITELSTSQEIMHLMSVLGLDLEKRTCTYKNIIIATDSDQDGSHISALLINLFHKWFPWIIEEGKVYLLNTPIITAKINNKLMHFYNKDEFYNKKYKNVKDKTYIKGLGSLDEHDWKLIFNEMNLFKITVDDQSSTLLNIAFSDDSSLRRKWLENKLTKKQ